MEIWRHTALMGGEVKRTRLRKVVLSRAGHRAMLLLLALLPRGADGFDRERIDALAVTNLTSDPQIVISALGETHNRDTVDVRVETIHERMGESAESASYVLEFSVLSEHGSEAHLILDENGFTGRTHAVAFTVILPPDSSDMQLTEVALEPAEPLDPNEAYQVRAVLFEWMEDDEGGRYVRRDVVATPFHRYLHFASTDSEDASFNVLGTLDHAEISRLFLVSTDPAAKAIPIPVSYSLRRFDAWNDPIASATVGIGFDAVLVEDSQPDSPIPIKPITFTHRTRSVPSYIAVNPPEPAELLHLTDTLFIEPADGVQLDPVNGSYSLKLTLRLENGPEQGYRDGGSWEFPNLQLLHFNGRLRFGTVETEITDIVNLPMIEGPPGPASVPSTVELGTRGAYVVGMPNHALGPTNPLLVDLYTNGTAQVVEAMVPVEYTPPRPDYDWQQNVRMRRDSVTLNQFGGMANLRVTLPGGMGWTSNVWSKTLSPFLYFEEVPVDQSLLPYQPQTAYGPFHVCEEARPLLFVCDEIQWNPTVGSFSFSEHDVVYVRMEELNALDRIAPQLADPESAVKASNEQYYRFAAATGGPTTIAAGTNGSARLQAEVELLPGAFHAHVPLGAQIAWNQPGLIHIASDRIDPSASRLAGCPEVRVPVDQGCGQQQACPGAPGVTEMVLLVESEELQFTADGGLHGVGIFRMPDDSDDFRWGAVPNSDTYAHTVGPMSAAGFYMPGHRIGPDVLTGITASAPAALLLAGVPGNDLTALELPGTPAYTNGLADYAGINLRIADNLSSQATSQIGGDPVGPYLLTTRSKYYARHSGVTGIHEAEPGSFPSSLTLYGYAFTFSNYGLSYRSSGNLESRTQGDVTLPYPSDFTQEFEQLLFTCVGGLDKATIPSGAGNKVLSYWKATIDPQQMVFQRNNACDPSQGWLTLGVSTEVAHIDQTLSGVLGFEPGGDLIAAAQGVKGVTSRLSLPPTIDLAAPSNQTYSCTVTTAAYFNDYSLAPVKTIGDGYVNLAGSLDIPYFQNMPIHLQTSADHQSASAPIFLAGGWPTSGWTEGGATFFSSKNFDSANRGLPPGVGVGDYRSTLEAYRPRAIQSWLDVIDFNYPLAWTSASGVFRSFQPQGTDVAVVTTEHKVDFLTPKKTKLTFAGKFNPVPVISAFDSALSDNLDKDTQQGAVFFEPLGKHVVNAIQSGQDAMEFVLADQPIQLFGRTLADQTAPVMGVLVSNLMVAAQSPPPGGDYYTDLVNGYVRGTGPLAPSYTVRIALGEMLESSGTVTGLIDRLDDSLASVGWWIDAMVTNVTVDPRTGTPLPTGQEQAGILTQDPTNVQSVVLARLLTDFISELKFVEDKVASGLEETVQEQIKDREPALNTIRSSFDDVRADLAKLRGRLAVGKDVRMELEQALQGTALDTAAAQAAGKMITFLQGLSANGQTVSGFTQGQLVDTLTWDVQNAFNGSPVPAAIQAVLRRHAYDLDASVQHATGAVFKETNEMLHDTVSALMILGDDGVVSLLGKLSPYAAAGSLRGYAYINGDSLRELRMDGKFLLNLTDEFKTSFEGYLLVKQLKSDGHDGCDYTGEKATEVTLAADEAKLEVLGFKIGAKVKARFAFDSDPFRPLGMAGSFKLKNGEKLNLKGMGIQEYGAAIALGETEAYLAGAVRGKFQDAQIAGGLFVGRTCTLDPFTTIDPRAAKVLGTPPFTGIYAYAEGWVKVLEWGWLDVAAGIGYGVFGFEEGTLGGRMLLGLKVQLIKIVSVTGEVMLVGVLDGLDPRLSGTGTLRGCLGYCPFCICAKGVLTIVYQDEDFEVTETEFDFD